MIEASDLKNAQDLFGELAEKFDDDMPKSEQLKSEQEFEAFAGLLVSKYISPHKVGYSIFAGREVTPSKVLSHYRPVHNTRVS